MRESEIQKQILQFFRTCREVARVWQNDTRATRARKYGAVGKDRPKGLPDITGFFVGGQIFFIECKTPTGKLSEDQERFLYDARDNGAYIGVCRSLEDAQEFICQYREIKQDEWDW